MSKCTQYSPEFKEKLLAKVFSPNAPSVVELARRAGIPSPTLSTWIRMSKKKQISPNDGSASLNPKDRTAAKKFQSVCDTFNMTEVERNAYCRTHGLYSHELDEWKTQMLSCISSPREQKGELRPYVSEIKQLRKELHRKEKALAETSALLILKKKPTCSGGTARKINICRRLACETLDISVRILERWQQEKNLEDKRCGPITQPANKLTEIKWARVLEIANSAEYCNSPPSQIVPRLADQEIYVASESTFYRILKQENQLTHRSMVRAKIHAKPGELIALQSNQVWSWDITYLSTATAGKFFYLYLFVDIFSRKIVGFDIFEQELSEHAATVVSKAYAAEGVQPGEVSLHSDNGSPMKGCMMLVMLQKLGIIPSFSRPSVSNDNPFSESLFRTLKYCPR